MRLSAGSAILSAVIFNALIIVALIPLALRGVKYRAVGAARLLRDNLLIYGLGGLVVPFMGIKLIDLLLVALHFVTSGWDRTRINADRADDRGSIRSDPPDPCSSAFY